MNKDELYKELKKYDTGVSLLERKQAYLRGESVDCIPYDFIGLGDAYAHTLGISPGEMMRSFDLRVEMIKRMREEYGIATIVSGPGLRGFGEAIGSTVVYPENSTDYISKHFLNDYGRLEEVLTFDVKKSPVLKRMTENALRLQELFPDHRLEMDVSGAISTAISIRPIELILRDFIRHPEELHRLLQFCVNVTLEWIKYFMAETGCYKVRLSDPATSTAIVGMQYFQEYSKPYLKKLIDGIYEISGDGPFVHICGQTQRIWRDLIDLGVKDFSVDNCESLGETVEILGDHMLISGNIAPVEVFMRGSIDDVINAVRNAIDVAAASPNGYVVMPGCQIPVGTPRENLDAYVYAVHRYGANAQIGKKPT